MSTEVCRDYCKLRDSERPPVTCVTVFWLDFVLVQTFVWLQQDLRHGSWFRSVAFPTDCGCWCMVCAVTGIHGTSVWLAWCTPGASAGSAMIYIYIYICVYIYILLRGGFCTHLLFTPIRTLPNLSHNHLQMNNSNTPGGSSRVQKKREKCKSLHFYLLVGPPKQLRKLENFTTGSLFQCFADVLQIIFY